MNVESTSTAKRLFGDTFDLTGSCDIINVKSAIRHFLINRYIHILEYYSTGISAPLQIFGKDQNWKKGSR
jgi:hypothetical protein